jgi:hypothetical protein
MAVGSYRKLHRHLCSKPPAGLDLALRTGRRPASLWRPNLRVRQAKGFSLAANNVSGGRFLTSLAPG